MILDRIRNIDSGVFIIADNDKCRIELRMINLKRNMNGRTHPNLRFHQYKKIKGTLLLYRNIEYYLNGNRHRTNGPAVIYLDGEEEYWLNGNRYYIELEYIMALGKPR